MKERIRARKQKTSETNKEIKDKKSGNILH